LDFESLGQVVSKRPVFIVGAPRSGTTLVQQMLDSHPSFAIPWESHFIPWHALILKHFGDLQKIEARALLIRSIDYFQGMVFNERAWVEWIPSLSENADKIAAQTPPHYAGVIDAIYTFYAQQRGRPRWGDKTPGYINHMPLILSMFPDAKFIHIIRDGRDVAVSSMPLSFGSNTTYVAARRWDRFVRRGLKFEAEHPESVLRLTYENLIANNEGELRRICDFLDEEFHPAMMQFHRSVKDRSSAPPDMSCHTELSKPANNSRIGRWKSELSLEQLRVFESGAGELLSELGYERAMPDARKRFYDRRLGKTANNLLFLRPFTKPSGLIERLKMTWNREAFMRSVKNGRGGLP
jgi:hypothetical protein